MTKDTASGERFHPPEKENRVGILETLQDYGTESSTGGVSMQTGLQRRAWTIVHAPEAVWVGEDKGVYLKGSEAGTV